MEYTTIQKNISDSPRKVRYVADMVRKMTPVQAVEMLSFTNRAAASPLVKAIKTALANAQGKTGLVFKKIEVNEGMKMKRNRVGTAGRGRSRPYRKRMAHIKIVLTDESAAPINKVEKVSKGEVKSLKSKVSETPANAVKSEAKPQNEEVIEGEAVENSENEEMVSGVSEAEIVADEKVEKGDK